MAKRNGYELSRAWFDFAFENAAKVNSGHTALFMWLCEINNRLGWVSEFQITAGECMNGMSCKSYKTYKKALDELILFGFVKMVKQSVNQYQCNIIAIVNNTEASTKALDKALLKHFPKQVQSTDQSTSHIHKPETSKPVNQKPKTNKQSSSSAKAEPSEPKITSKFLAVYNDFLQKRTGTAEQFSIAGRAALKKIIDYLTSQVKNKNPDQPPEYIEEQTVFSWEWILSNFDYWEPFHQNQLKLNQIESNLLNIIASAKKKKTNGRQIDPQHLAAEAMFHFENSGR